MKIPTLYEVAHKYFEFRKGRASELECLRIYLEALGVGYSRRSLEMVLKTVDILQGRIENGVTTVDGVKWR